MKQSALRHLAPSPEPAADLLRGPARRRGRRLQRCRRRRPADLLRDRARDRRRAGEHQLRRLPRDLLRGADRLRPVVHRRPGMLRARAGDRSRHRHLAAPAGRPAARRLRPDPLLHLLHLRDQRRPMDQFVEGAICGASPKNFAYADASSVGYYRDLAGRYALADRYFQPITGASSSNDMYFARASFVFEDNTYVPADAIGTSLRAQQEDRELRRCDHRRPARRRRRELGLLHRGLPDDGRRERRRRVPAARSRVPRGLPVLSLRVRSQRHPLPVLPALPRQPDLHARLRALRERPRRAASCPR